VFRFQVTVHIAGSAGSEETEFEEKYTSNLWPLQFEP